MLRVALHFVRALIEAHLNSHFTLGSEPLLSASDQFDQCSSENSLEAAHPE